MANTFLRTAFHSLCWLALMVGSGFIPAEAWCADAAAVSIHWAFFGPDAPDETLPAH